MAGDDERYPLARAIIISTGIASLAALAIAGAWVIEYGDAHSRGNWAMGSIVMLFAGLVVVLIGLMAGLTHLRNR